MAERAINEIGTAPGRGRELVARDEAERELSAHFGRNVDLPEGAWVDRGPATCPACGSRSLLWACLPEQQRPREEIHPLVWHETQWLADSFICRDCWAGWIEPDDAEPIT